ncbi:MAG: hypothetical protein RLZZ338_1519 [Cyanobacteriota bacterium]
MKEEGRMKKEEGRMMKEEGRRKKHNSCTPKILFYDLKEREKSTFVSLCLCGSFLFIWYYDQTASRFWLFSQGYNHKDTKAQRGKKRETMEPRGASTWGRNIILVLQKTLDISQNYS